jgi:hypothetical protein
MGTHIQEIALGARRRPAPDFCEDSHACDLGELLNTGRSTLPRVRRALSAPEHAQRPTPRAPRRAELCPCPLLTPAPIKPPQALTVLLRARSTSPELETHRRSPCRQRARGHSIPRHRRPACRALPSHARPSEETVHASMKLPEQGIGLCLAGEASPRSPDFTRPPVNGDRVSLCPILRFLVHIASTSSRGAHRAI